MKDSAYRRLVVMRHAKTEQFASNDRGRRLTGRGRRDATQAGRWLSTHGVVPDFVLISSATRAVGTWERVREGLGTSPRVRMLEELYSASVDDALELCALAPDSAVTVLMIGHNPTMAELAQALQREPQEKWAPHLPTSGLAVLDCDAAWDDMQPGVAALMHWYAPRG
ncbi:MAG: SixA phosphatase family protein [Nocardioidaceae bacterium]